MDDFLLETQQRVEVALLDALFGRDWVACLDQLVLHLTGEYDALVEQHDLQNLP